jgi:hypothetical protein
MNPSWSLLFLSYSPLHFVFLILRRITEPEREVDNSLTQVCIRITASQSHHSSCVHACSRSRFQIRKRETHQRLTPIPAYIW